MNPLLRKYISAALCGCAVLLAVSIPASPTSTAKPRFRASDLEAAGSDWVACDLDGDGLKDLVFVDGSEAAVFYQDRIHGFQNQPHFRLAIADLPALLWPARLGPGAELLLVLTCDGVTALSITNRAGPPARTRLIQQRTLVPHAIGRGLSQFSSRANPHIMVFPISARTAEDWPLLLVPVESGLEVWRHGQKWERAQTLDAAVRVHNRPLTLPPGFARSAWLSYGVSDVNNDGKEELMTRHNEAPGTQVFTLFQQTAAGRFGPTQTTTCHMDSDWRTWLCWVDLNGDGLIDLIKSVPSPDPWFYPGTRTSKVLTGIFLADNRGNIPPQPQQVFRKDDSIAALPIVDVDGDGCPDVVLGSAPFDSREGVRKMITARQLQLTLKFHFSRPGSGLPKEPECQTQVQLRIDEHTAFLSQSLRDNFERCVNLSADFNGDGRPDLLTRDRSGHASTRFFISRKDGFSPEADLLFASPDSILSFAPCELNGDKISDLILKTQKPHAYRVFTSQ